MATQSILEFWKSHPQYWVSIGEKQAEADELISRLYFTQKIEDLPFLDAVIYCDQFMRHFSRVAYTGVDERMVTSARHLAVALVKSNMGNLFTLPEDELMFALMPLKHMMLWESLFCTLHGWLPHGETFTNYPLLNRFYNDSYKKAYGDKPLALRPSAMIGTWSAVVCESCPPMLDWGLGTLPPCGDLLMAALRDVAKDGHLWVSLSGGVDSNLLCALGRRAGLNVSAVHIVYGNRDVAEQEAAFIADYCGWLGVRLYLYRVPWIRRATADRAFYESITRQLRFNSYKAAGAAEAGICLGHIQEDVVENIWTNFAHGVHLENLTKMSGEVEEDGVRILRPWLSVSKANIYAVADALNIPHLKNTTPAWSNRGKFRAAFYPATHTQYGESVDKKVLEVAETLRVQAAMLERLLYKPVFDSWSDGCVDVSPIFAAGGLDGAGWSRILTHFCHTHLGISKPSIHACRDLSQRLQRPFTCLKIPIKRGLLLEFSVREGKYHMNMNAC
jgi:tRNA(Ile)-lysidine synthase TilS/MesJ